MRVLLLTIESLPFRITDVHLAFCENLEHYLGVCLIRDNQRKEVPFMEIFNRYVPFNPISARCTQWQGSCKSEA